MNHQYFSLGGGTAGVVQITSEGVADLDSIHLWKQSSTFFLPTCLGNIPLDLPTCGFFRGTGNADSAGWESLLNVLGWSSTLFRRGLYTHYHYEGFPF